MRRDGHDRIGTVARAISGGENKAGDRSRRITNSSFNHFPVNSSVSTVIVVYRVFEGLS